MTLERSLFLVWGPPSHGPRSRVFARSLDIDIAFVEVTGRRGLLVAPYKYARQAQRTLRILHQRGPNLVFVQSPPSFAALVVAGYCAMRGRAFIVDAHSDAMLSPWWTRPRWLHRALSRRALVTIVTNEHFAQRLEAMGATALVLRDIPTVFPSGAALDLDEGFHIMVVSTFAADEPLTNILAAAREASDVTFHVTGKIDQHRHQVPAPVPANLRFTGFLPDEDYFALMARADVVMCLTTRNHTMQRGACEASSMGRPIITSDWPLLREYFDSGTIHVDNSPASIVAAVREMQSDHAAYVAGIRSLQSSQREQWDRARARLAALLDGHPGKRAGVCGDR